MGAVTWSGSAGVWLRYVGVAKESRRLLLLAADPQSLHPRFERRWFEPQDFSGAPCSAHLPVGKFEHTLDMLAFRLFKRDQWRTIRCDRDDPDIHLERLATTDALEVTVLQDP